MESKQVKDIIRQFAEKDTYKKIFINGAWGIGKSFYTEEYRKENPDGIVYVSLFGKDSFESIEDAIAVELLNKYDLLKRTTKKIWKFTKKFSSTISFNGISISSPSIEKKNFFKNYSKVLDNNKLIIVIDDLERKSCNVSINDIMGLIEQFSQYNNIKVLIIGSENNLEKEELKKWKKFKEKIIEKEYNITSFSEEAIESIVVESIKEYIRTEELKVFIKEFLENHKTSNLRSIEKGVKLFLEIVENYLNNKYDEKIYIAILKNCMAVAIEFSEELYKPSDSTKKTEDSFKTWEPINDEDMYSRILSNYFHSIFITTKESSLLEYIISFYLGEISDIVVKDFNHTIENYVNKKEEKDLFYLSEDTITTILKDRYDTILKEKYKFTSLEQLIQDFNELTIWNDELKIGLDMSCLSDKFNSIIFDNYYSIDKEMHQNAIDSFEIMRYKSKKLEELIDNYNRICSEKYTKDKLDRIIKEYSNKTYNKDKLQWLEWSLMQDNKDIIRKFVMIEFKKHNYLIPDLSGEISEDIWSWTHKIWEIYFERFKEPEKTMINKSIEKMKINNIASSRINTLQKYRPLVEIKETEQDSKK